MRKSILTAAVFALLAAASTVRAETPPDLKIGVLLCLSGACQESGTNALNGLRMAQEELNGMGGVLGRHVELVVQDTREMESPASAVSAYKQLRLDPSIKMFIGPTWSVGAMTLAPIIAHDTDVLIISPTVGVESFNESADNIFNVWPHDSVSTRGLAKYAIDHGLKRAAILSNFSPWESTQATIFREEYKKLGGEEAVFIEINATDSDLRPYAAKIKNAKPDLVFASNYTQLHLVGKAFSQIKFPVQLMTILLEDTVVKNAAGTLDGIIYAAYEPATLPFTRRYRQKYGASPGMGSDTGYDALMVLAHISINANSTEPEKNRLLLFRLTHDGASGVIRFDEKGGVVKSPLFMKLTGDQRERLAN